MIHRDISPPIHLSSTYAVTWDEAKRLAHGDESVAFYARYGSPTVRHVEEQVRSLCVPDAARVEEYDALLTASGMAAITTTMLALLSSGDEVLATDTIYGGTAKLLRHELPRFGITARFTPCDLSHAEAQITAQTKLLWVESPANPVNRLVVFEKAVALARRHNLIACIDGTLAPPPLQYPLAHGFDIELHAATKYLGGHSDLLAGVLVGRRELVARIRAMHRVVGAALDPHAAFLLSRGLLTLPLRMRQINATALHLARWLVEHPAVERVHYLGLESHPDHPAACRQMSNDSADGSAVGFGGIVAFDLNEQTESAVERFVASLRLIRHAPSLGGTETLMSYPPLSSHAGQTDEQLQAASITRGTVRLAIGLEAAEDLERDLHNALLAV
jgi:cystathionine beta-lyase/cystathionine gamma-synthase